MKYTYLFLLAFFALQINSLAQPSTPNLASYDELKRQVRDAFVRGEERTADAVERERVQTYWEVGKLIDEHILLHKERAEYGKEVIKRLSNDLQISERELYYMVEFARTYPILRTSAKLSWNHYEALLSINDVTKREMIADQADKENWTVKETRAQIKKLKTENPRAVSEELKEEPLIPIKGSLDIYRLVNAKSGQWKGKPVIDLGFSNYLELPKKYKKKFKAGDIVHSNDGKLELAKGATIADLFTYRGYLLDVTDGDTLWVWIDLGFGVSTTQQLRLRGIDTPEIVTRDGQAAKEFVEQELFSSLRSGVPSEAEAIPGSEIASPDRPSLALMRGALFGKDLTSFSESAGTGRLSGRPPLEQPASPSAPHNDKLSQIIVATSKSDKYDRYLADIYYETKTGEHYLNNRLLEEKLAVRV